MSTIDTTDRQLLDILQQNGRVSNAELARRMEMAPSAVLQRVRRLEERGVIRGYVAQLDPDTVSRGLVAFIHLRTDERLGEPHVAGALAEIEDVLEVHDIAGDDCYLVKVRTEDTTSLHDLIRGRIAAIPGVATTRTTIVLKTFVELVALALPDDS